MSFTAPDFAEFVEQKLVEAGYTFEECEDEEADEYCEWRWTFGEFHSEWRDSQYEAMGDALDDYTHRLASVRSAAAVFLMCEADETRAELTDAIDASITGDVSEFMQTELRLASDRVRTAAAPTPGH